MDLSADPALGDATSSKQKTGIADAQRRSSCAHTIAPRQYENASYSTFILRRWAFIVRHLTTDVIELSPRWCEICVSAGVPSVPYCMMHYSCSGDGWWYEGRRLCMIYPLSLLSLFCVARLTGKRRPGVNQVSSSEISTSPESSISPSLLRRVICFQKHRRSTV